METLKDSPISDERKSLLYIINRMIKQTEFVERLPSLKEEYGKGMKRMLDLLIYDYTYDLIDRYIQLNEDSMNDAMRDDWIHSDYIDDYGSDSFRYDIIWDKPSNTAILDMHKLLCDIIRHEHKIIKEEWF